MQNLIILIALLLQYEKEGCGEADGDQDGGIRGHREDGNTACHVCKSAGSKTLDREEGESGEA